MKIVHDWLFNRQCGEHSEKLTSAKSFAPFCGVGPFVIQHDTVRGVKLKCRGFGRKLCGYKQGAFGSHSWSSSHCTN